VLDHPLLLAWPKTQIVPWTLIGEHLTPVASAAVGRLVTREINVSVTKAETTGTEDTGDD
jgi:hypothetical protein